MDVYELILIAALLTSIYPYVRGWQVIPYFFQFMMIVVAFEMFVTHYWAKVYGTNILVYNVFSFICLSYYFMVFRQLLIRSEKIMWINGVIVVWALYSLISMCDGQISDSINIASYNAGMITVVSMIFYHFYRVIYLLEYSDVFRIPQFYLAIGILVFYSSSFTILTFLNVLVANQEVTRAYSDILTFGNIFLSMAYLTAALCQCWKTTSTG